MKTMRLLLAILVFSAVSLSSSAQQSKQYSDSQYSVQYHVRNGLLNGKYISCYSNGNKRAEGNFSNNNRTGKWIVYDSTGKKQVVRNYKSLFSYKRIYPKPYKKGPAKLLSEPAYKVRNISGKANNYFSLEIRDVVYTKRSWLYIDAGKNKVFFSTDSLMTCLKTALKEDSVTVYSNEDDEFRKALTSAEALKILNSNTIIAGFLIKEDAVFDNQRFLTESRIIGLCPLVKDTDGNYRALFWIYMPQFVNSLAQVKAEKSGAPEYIETLDDVFFNRYFNASWVYSSSVYDRTFDEKLQQIDDNAQYTDKFIINQIETEHDLWMKFFGN